MIICAENYKGMNFLQRLYKKQECNLEILNYILSLHANLEWKPGNRLVVKSLKHFFAYTFSI